MNDTCLLKGQALRVNGESVFPRKVINSISLLFQMLFCIFVTRQLSEWRISLPKESNQFDFATISDVILHIRYTAVAGSTNLAKAATDNLNAILPTSGLRLLILKHEFSGEWHRFLHPAVNSDQELAFTLKPEHLPFYARNKNVHLSKVDLIVESDLDGISDVDLQLPGINDASTVPMNKDPAFDGAYHMEKRDFSRTTDVLGNWRIQLNKNDPTFPLLKPEDIQNAYLVIMFKIQIQ
jgi:hypothetical protein